MQISTVLKASACKDRETEMKKKEFLCLWSLKGIKRIKRKN
jgi:hypothetical protein